MVYINYIYSIVMYYNEKKYALEEDKVNPRHFIEMEHKILNI